MCIAVPVQVLSTTPGRALTLGRDGERVVDTALVGEVQVGDWLLVFLDSARSLIDADRAAEVNAMLDLVEHAMSGMAPRGANPNDADDPGPRAPSFILPSAMTAEQLAAFAGHPTGVPQ